MSTTFDIIVIGAGMAGASVAAELADGQRVLLLEGESRPGMHATGRSAALYSEIYGNAPIRALTRAGLDWFLSGSEGDAPFATLSGCLHIATPDQIEALRTFAGLPDVAPAVVEISGAEARERIPILKEGVIAAALSERSAFDLDVDAIHQHFLRRFANRGGTLVSDAAVTELKSQDGSWQVRAGGETYAAPVVVNAAGAWGDVVAGLAGVKPVGLEPCRRTIALVDLPPGISARDWPAVIDIDEQFYFKPSSGLLLLSPADETPSAPCDAAPEEMDIAIAVDRVQGVADLPVRRVSHSWAGLRTFAPDRTPVVGYDPAAPGFFWLVGQGGYGIQTAPALSRLAAALVRGGEAPTDLIAQGLDIADLSPARF